MLQQPDTDREKPQGSKIDPSKITGPYPLLAVLLVILEGLLGSWLYIADSGAERITAGVLMTLLLVAVMIVVVIIQHRAQQQSTPLTLHGVEGEAKPATHEADPAEIEAPLPDIIAAPDRSYVLDRPPDDWIVRELTLNEYFAANFDVRPEVLSAELQAKAAAQSREILMVQARDTVLITPVPGKTKVDGRLFLTALPIPTSTSLAVLPLDRAQPPLFAERPFEHNFHVAVGQVVATGAITLRRTGSGRLPLQDRKIAIAEFRQDLEGALINGAPADVSVNINVIAIEGYVRDHLLISRYLSRSTGEDVKLDSEHKTLLQLISSFRPIKISDPAAEVEKLRKRAEEGYAELIERAGKTMFGLEFRVFCWRAKTLNLENPVDRLRIIEGLRQFETFARAVKIDGLNDLWDALHEAETGDASALKKELVNVITEVDELATPAVAPAAEPSLLPPAPAEE